MMRQCGVLVGLLLAVTCAHATLQDEIQVYTDDINAPGENGLELHINSTPSSAVPAQYAGELTNNHGVRVTPEFSHGLTSTTELGLYLPTEYANDGNYYLAGIKLRFKWLPIQTQNGEGFFAGMNFELSQLKYPFSDSARSLEIRNILGWKNHDWLLAVNPIFDVALSSGHTQQNPDFNYSTKLDHRVTESVWLGWEYYDDRGAWANPWPGVLQNKVNYLVMDYFGEPFDFNLGVGRGADNLASDKWTLKAIIEVPYSF